MNRFLLSILTLLFPLQLMGQMFPLSDRYAYNALAINPAFAGSHDALSATVLYRNQWVGFRDAPKGCILSVHAPVNSDRVGVGLLIEKNSIGIFNETSIVGNYAYRLDLPQGKLALGLGFGATVYNVAWNELQIADADDSQLMNNPTSAILPDFSLGTYYYTPKYFIGISIPLFLSHEPEPGTGKYRTRNNFSKYNYFLTGGYEVGINRQVKFLPSLLVRYNRYNVIQVDFNAQLNLNNRIWVGVGYRNPDKLVGMVQFQLNHQLRLAYSYDFDLGRIGRYTKGSQEIGLSYLFSYTRKVKGPRQF